MGGCSAAGNAPSSTGGSSNGASGGSGAGGHHGSAGGSGGSGVGGGIQIDGGGGSGPKLDASSESSLLKDGAPDVPTTCVDGGVKYTPGPYARKCAPPTDNECDGHSDINPNLPNGQYGNGFDDDCDGLVDEGCPCPPGVLPGGTEKCWLVPASQADSTGQAVGWCRTNSLGTEACITTGSGEFTKNVWSGECRGAQPPYANDVCANGDFDCDGLAANSKTDDCACQTSTVQCPTNPLVTAPYPNPAQLPEINGATWIKSANAASATNWKWTVTGGDCDNILPHPSFQIFNNQNATGQALGGTQASGLGPNGNQTGLVAGPGPAVDATLYPAFALSGDYLVKGEFDLAGKHYACTVQVQVRAPGIRAELCWTPMPNDIDLHFGRLQGATGCDGPHGWFESCKTSSGGDDCYYNSVAGCAGGGVSPNWGYANSAQSTCVGWGSRRKAASAPFPVVCTNPRLDLDNITCSKNTLDPNNSGLGGELGAFCGPENINLDNPHDGDRFVVAAHAYHTTAPVHPHINVYCNGERVLSVGYDPITAQNFPVLLQSGPANGNEVPDDGGDLWVAASIQAVVQNGQLTDCKVAGVPSSVFKANKDGSTNFCVDTNPENAGTPPADDRHWNFTASGAYPTATDALCWH
jgi:hypothetical protein